MSRSITAIAVLDDEAGYGLTKITVKKSGEVVEKLERFKTRDAAVTARHAARIAGTTRKGKKMVARP